MESDVRLIKTKTEHSLLSFLCLQHAIVIVLVPYDQLCVVRVMKSCCIIWCIPLQISTKKTTPKTISKCQNSKDARIRMKGNIDLSSACLGIQNSNICMAKLHACRGLDQYICMLYHANLYLQSCLRYYYMSHGYIGLWLIPTPFQSVLIIQPCDPV